MKYAAVLLALAVPFGASAQMVDEPVCYSWNGGHMSAGSFSKCGPTWVIAKKAPPPAPVVTPVAAPSPIMMPMQSCPPAPVPKPMVKKRKPLPVKC